jgi:hypothetical protein
MEHLEHTDDPLKEAPQLRSLKGRPEPFIAPPGFFDRFPHMVQDRIVVQKAGPSRGVWLKRLALSIGVVAMVFAIWRALPNSDRPIEDAFNAGLVLDISPQELPMDEALVWEVYADADRPLFGEVTLELEEHELYAYLEHENVDVELLMTEF